MVLSSSLAFLLTVKNASRLLSSTPKPYPPETIKNAKNNTKNHKNLNFSEKYRKSSTLPKQNPRKKKIHLSPPPTPKFLNALPQLDLAPEQSLPATKK
jgi:hypothetical protein